MKFLYAARKVESRIKSLKKTGKAGRNLADKAESIIERLTSGMTGPEVNIAGRLTKYGEKRIKNCRKYDLGCGYRLITIQRGSTVYVPFLGSHDDCQRWLENNIRLKDMNPDTGKMICIEEKNSKSMEPEENLNMESIQKDDEFINHLTDRDLRRVFLGLSGNLN